MKLSLLSGVLLLVSALAPRQGNSEPIASDSFDYPEGPIYRSYGGKGFASSYGGNGQVKEGSLSYSDARGKILESTGNHVTTSPNVNGMLRVFSVKDRPAGMLDPQDKLCADGTRVYLAFLVRLDSGTVDNFGDYGGVSLFEDGTEQLFIGDPGFDGSKIFWAVDPQEGAEGVQSSKVRVDSTVRLLVTRIDFAFTGATVRFYVDPPLDAEPADPAVKPFTMPDFRFDRIRIQSGGHGIYSFDELSIGTTYSDVVKALAAVPSKG